jgi:hypothetical protein
MIGTITALIAVVLVVFFGLKLLKSIIIFKVLFKVISLAFIVLIIIMAGSAYYMIKDANDFRKNFMNENNLFVLSDSDNGTILSAFELKNKTYSEVNDLTYVSDSFKKYEFTNINDDYYKIVLIKTDTLDYFNDIEFTEMNIKLTGQELKKVLESGTPKEELTAITGTNTNIENLKISDAQLKDYLFSYVITELFNPKNINTLLSNIKADNIVISEDTAFFKAIKFVPSIFIKDITKNGNQTIFS